MDSIFRKKSTIKRYRQLPFGSWLDGFVHWLSEHGYAPSGIQQKLISLQRVGKHLVAQKRGPEALLDKNFIQGFSQVHIRRAARSLVEYACQAGFLSAPAPTGSLSEPTWLQSYLDYCRTHRGLGEATLWKRSTWIRRFSDVLGHSGDAHPVLSVLDLDRFTTDTAQRYSRSTTHGLVAALRCYLSYRFLMGVDSRDRSKFLSYPLVYRDMKLPMHLHDRELEQIMTQIDRTTSYGKRDWAVWMLLVAYGLRAGEIAQLRMDELDFSESYLKVRRLKGGGAQLLPMTRAVEQSLRAYLEGGRPDKPFPEVFLVHRAPIRPFRGGTSLSRSCVRKYFERATLRRQLPSVGSHVLRHTAARRLLEQGTPLPIIQKVLAHQDPQTTKSYLRISTEQIRGAVNGYADLL